MTDPGIPTASGALGLSSGGVLDRRRLVALAVALVVPIAGLLLLIVVPELDVRWQHRPAHFWLVLTVAVLNAVLGLATGEAAARRSDARTLLASNALLLSAGFLGLHALATPGVLLDGPNTGFVIATPVGLLLASPLAAASAGLGVDGPTMGLRVARLLRSVVVALLVAWAVASLVEAPPLGAPPAEEGPTVVRVLAPVAVVLYGYAAVRYAQLHRARRRMLPLAFAVAWVLLAEAMIAIVFARSWQASWWEWHVLMAIAFGTIFVAARAAYRREGTVVGALAGLYREQTLAMVDEQSSRALQAFTDALEREDPLEPVRRRLATEGLTGERIVALEQSARQLQRVGGLLQGYVGAQLADQFVREPELARLGGREVEVSVLFADLVGFTTFSESRPPEEGMELLNTYWAAVVPAVVEEYGGVVERFAGDGIVVIFNTLGDQPDHAMRAVGCAGFVQHETARIAEQHAGWPRFRIGINTGPAVVGNVGAAQRRNFTVIGDTANTAARLEALASPGTTVLGPSTYAHVRGHAEIVSLGPQSLKGKAEPLEVYELVAP